MEILPSKKDREAIARLAVSETFHAHPSNPSTCEAWEANNRQGRKCPCEEKWRDHLPKGKVAGAILDDLEGTPPTPEKRAAVKEWWNKLKADFQLPEPVVGSITSGIAPEPPVVSLVESQQRMREKWTDFYNLILREWGADALSAAKATERYWAMDFMDFLQTGRIPKKPEAPGEVQHVFGLGAYPRIGCSHCGKGWSDPVHVFPKKDDLYKQIPLGHEHLYGSTTENAAREQRDAHGFPRLYGVGEPIPEGLSLIPVKRLDLDGPSGARGSGGAAEEEDGGFPADYADSDD